MTADVAGPALTAAAIAARAPTAPSIEARLDRAGLPALPRLAWLEIDTDALRDNLRAIRVMAGTDAEVAPVVKADAYGHGVEGVLDVLAGEVGTVCVATLDEGLEVRRLAPTLRVIVLYPVPTLGVSEAVDAGLELVASDDDDTRRLLAAWAGVPSETPPRAGTPPRLRLHLEVETGLQRGGLAPERVADAAARIAAVPGVRLAGLWSHLARPEDPAASAAQVERFEAAQAALAAAGIPVPQRHLGASGGIFAGTAPAYEMVRPGLALYGELPDEVAALAGPDRVPALRPVMTLKARPVRFTTIAAGTPVGYGGRWIAERESAIVTLPIGYGDGWARGTSPGSSALVRGRRVPLVGTVAMDAVIADITDVPGVDTDDEFVLLGAQGDDRIRAQEVAHRRTTIAWEVVTDMAERLPRVYHAGPDVVALRTAGVQTVHRSRGRPS